MPMRLAIAIISVVLLSLPAGEKRILAAEQNSPGTLCLSYEPAKVEIVGKVVRKAFADATAKPETEWLIELSQPVCVIEDPKNHEINAAQSNIRSIQLVFLNREMYTKYQNLLGQRVIATGTLFAAITAHHHTPVLLTVSALKSVP